MHEVLRVLAARARAGSQPGRRDDGFRVALAVEGGGMRGTVSAGMAYDSNIFATQNRTSDGIGIGRAGATVSSQWSRHSLQLTGNLLAQLTFPGQRFPLLYKRLPLLLKSFPPQLQLCSVRPCRTSCQRAWPSERTRTRPHSRFHDHG